MMRCSDLEIKLSLYFDGEMSPDQVGIIEEHIKMCPRCAMAVEREKNFESLLRRSMTREKAPYEIREAIINELEKSSGKRGSFSIFRPQFQAIFAGVSLVCVILVAVWVAQRNAVFPVYSSAIKTHIEAMNGSYPAQIVSGDMQEVLDWFKDKVGFTVQAPHINMKAVKLVGARVVPMKDKKAAYFMFEKDGHIISAFYMNLQDTRLPAIPESDIKRMPAMDLLAKTEKGFQSFLCYHRDQSGCVFVSDLPREELAKLIG